MFDKLDSNSIILASKLAREIRKRSGMIISLQDEDLVRELGKGVIALDERDLNLLYQTLLDTVEKAALQEANATKGAGFKSRQSRILDLLGRRKGDSLGH